MQHIPLGGGADERPRIAVASSSVVPERHLMWREDQQTARLNGVA